MKRVLFLIIILTVPLPAFSQTKDNLLLPFHGWKLKKLNEAKSIALELKRELKKTKAQKSDDDEDTKAVEKRAQQADQNVLLAKDLSANDYFVLYVYPVFGNQKDAL